MATGRNFFNVGNQFGTSLSTHISNFDDIGRQLIFFSFSMGRRANENLNSVDGRFQRNFNFIGGQ